MAEPTHTGRHESNPVSTRAYACPNFITSWIRYITEEWTARRLEKFTYTRLDSPSASVRLIDLEDGNDGDMLRCTLKVAPLDQHIDFDAASYSWRKDQAGPYLAYMCLWMAAPKLFPRYWTTMGRQCVIICDGKLLRIQENLYDFLLELRQKKRGRSLWVDAICIDQGKGAEEEAERGHQIKMMADIYGSAASVLVWLGHSTSSTDYGLWLLERFASMNAQITEHYGGPNVLRTLYQQQPMENMMEVYFTDRNYSQGVLWKIWPAFWGWHGFEAILSRDYFERAWVIQELSLAKEFRLFIGSKEISFGPFVGAINWMSHFLGLMSAGTSLQVGTIGSAAFPSLLKRRQQLQEGTKWTLVEAMSISRDRKATVLRDKVFAFLGLVNNPLLSNLPLDTMVTNLIEADTTNAVFVKCTIAMAESTSWPHVLSLVGKGQHELGCNGLPSWVPDYSAPLKPQPFWAHGCPNFRAAISARSEFEVVGEKVASERLSWVLRLSAASFGIVEQVGESAGLHPMGAAFMKGQILDVVNKLPDIYCTGESPMTALFRTVTADVFEYADFTKTALYSSFYMWMETQFVDLEATQKQWQVMLLARILSLIINAPAVRSDVKLFEKSGLTLSRALDEFYEKNGKWDDSGTLARYLNRTKLYKPKPLPSLLTRSRRADEETPEGSLGPKTPATRLKGIPGAKGLHDDAGPPRNERPQPAIPATGWWSANGPGRMGGSAKVGPQKSAGGGKNATHHAEGMQFETAFRLVYQDRRIFRTTNNYLGIGPAALKVGDKVMLVAGADVPFIFRDAEMNNGELRLVGSAFIHGIMYGELFGASSEPEFHTRLVV